MRSPLPLAGWVGMLLLLLAGCATDWKSASSPASGRISGPSSSTQQSADKGVANIRSTKRRSAPRPGPAIDDDSQADSAAVGRTPIKSGRSDAVEQTSGLFPIRKSTDRPRNTTKPFPRDVVAVVDEEMPDASFEEKQGILADFDGMSAENVRAMLRAWKQGLSRKATRSSPTAVEKSAGETVPASGELTAAGRIKKSLSAGLGSVTAWGSAIVGGKKGENSSKAAPSPLPATPAAEVEAIVPDTDENLVSTDDVNGIPKKTDRDSLQILIESHEREVANLHPGETQRQWDEYVARHVSLRMLYLVSGRHELAMQVIPEIESADQEFWQHLFWGLANYFDAESIPAHEERAAETAAQLTQSVLKLQRRAQLEIRQLTICQSIEGFGVYEPFDINEFEPGQELSLYAEFGNVQSLPDDGGQYRSGHISVIEIMRNGGDGDPLARFELPETVDRCRRPRRDYYHSYVFDLPEELVVGTYSLKLSVTDTTSGRRSSQSLNFRVKRPSVAHDTESRHDRDSNVIDNDAPVSLSSGSKESADEHTTNADFPDETQISLETLENDSEDDDRNE